MTKLNGMRGLGRGLDSLFAGDGENAGDSDILLMLNVAQLRPGKFQPRSYMDEEALQALAASIKSQGIMQPILVRKLMSKTSTGEQYEIVAGERRWRASKIAGIETVPVLVREIADESALAMALIENIQRENLNPLEEAQGIKRLIEEFAMTHEKAAEAVGRSRVAVSNLLRLLTLCTPVQEMLMQNKFDMGHARALIGLSEAEQVMFAEQIVIHGYSVRETEKLVKKLTQVPNQQSANPRQPTNKMAIDKEVVKLQTTLSATLGAPVMIKANQKGAGTMKINYTNSEHLEEIIARISRQ